MATTLQTFASLVLGVDAVTWCAERKADGATNEEIATQLGDTLGSPVSRETIRLWLAAETDEVPA